MAKHIYALMLAVTTAVLIITFAIPTRAVEDETVAMDTMPPAYLALEDKLPQDLVQMLPEGVFSQDPAHAMDAVRQASTFDYFLGVIARALGLCVGDALRLLCTMVGLMLLSSVLRRLQEAVGGKGGEVLGFGLRLVLYAAMVTPVVAIIGTATSFFSQLHTLTAAMIPTMGVLLALGGNTGQAMVNGELLMIFLHVIGYVSGTLTPPLCGICMALALPEALGSRMHTAALAAIMKKTYVAILGLATFLLSMALTLQTTLTSRADGLAMRGVKYAVGQWIPVVGGAVSGTLGTVAAAVEAMRGVCGVCGMILVALLLIPTLLRILLMRWSLTLSVTVSSLLACEGEGKLLSEMTGLYGYLAAAVSLSAVVVVLAMGLLAGSAAALA